MKYILRPGFQNEIEATQWNNVDMCPSFRNENDELLRFASTGSGLKLWVEKSQAWCSLNFGDYIIVEPDKTGCYPMEKKLFEKKYKLAVAE